MKVEKDWTVSSNHDYEPGRSSVRYINNVTPFGSATAEVIVNPQLSRLTDKISRLSSSQQRFLESMVDTLLASA